MGIHISDNLTNAEHVLIVEGEDDKIALEKLLPSMSTKIKRAIQNGTFIIDYIGGAGNLPYKLSFYRNLQCKYHVLLDNDDAGRHAGSEAERQGLLDVRNVTYAICNGSPNAEIEDCYNKAVYENAILNEFGVNINVANLEEIKSGLTGLLVAFLSQRKLWNDAMEKKS